MGRLVEVGIKYTGKMTEIVRIFIIIKSVLMERPKKEITHIVVSILTLKDV